MSKIQIKSPIPGTFFRRPAPSEPKFQEDGASVSENDVVGLVEVMKTFHQISAGVKGTNLTFTLEDSEPVMAGQVIAEVNDEN